MAKEKYAGSEALQAVIDLVKQNAGKYLSVNGNVLSLKNINNSDEPLSSVTIEPPINLTASRAVISNQNGKLAVSTATSTELSYVHGVTSSIQAQLNAKQPTVTGAASTVTSSDLAVNRIVVSNASGKIVASSVSTNTLSYLDVTSSIQTQLNNLSNNKQNKITGAASSVVTNNLTGSRVVISNADGKIAASAITTTKLGYLTDVNSNIQAQLDGKQPAITVTANRALVSDANGKVAASSTITTTELGYLNNVSSNIQTQLNGKQSKIVGGATTIVDDNLTANRALISNSDGKVAVSSSITTTELGYLDGVTSNIQTQLNSLVYKKGDVVSGSGAAFTWYGAGYMTNENKQVRFVIPLTRPIISGTLNLTALTLAAVQNGIYILGSLTVNYNPIADGNCTVSVAATRSGIRVQLAFANALGGVTNSPIGIMVASYAFSLT